jgi:uncharacterized protein YabE (DUF348 family)
LLVLAIVAGTVGFVAFQKTVTVSIDGTQKTVHTFSGTVGQMLARQGIAVDAHDAVAPALSSKLSDGDTVAVRYGRLLHLTLDGTSRDIWVTARNVDEALDQLGMRADGAYLSASRSMSIGRTGLTLAVRTPKAITIAVDGKATNVTTTEPNAIGALTEAGVELGVDDIVVPSQGALLTDGLVVSVKRVTREDISETIPIPNAVETRTDASMYKDETDVLQVGKPGAKVLTWQIVRYDNVEAYRMGTGESVTAQPVTEIRVVGTKARPAPPATPPAGGGGGGGSGVWDQLANCESGGNWAINTGNGYYGGLQFSLGTWLAYGGGSYAHLPSDASREQQISVAERLRATSGFSPWPACARKLGLL